MLPKNCARMDRNEQREKARGWDNPISISSTFTPSETNTAVLYKTRSSTELVKEVVDALTVGQQNVVRELGLGGLLDIKGFRIDDEFLTWLVNNFNCETRTLDVHGVKMKITPTDVERVIGVSCNGMDVSLVGLDLTIDEDLEALLEIPVKDGVVVLSRIKKELKTLVSHGSAFRVKFILFMLGKLLAPSPYWAHRRALIPLLYNIQTAGKVNWARLVVDELINGIAEAKKNSGPEVYGCVVLLMVLYLDNFNLSHEGYQPLNDRFFPRLGWWDNAKVKERVFALKTSGLFAGAKVGVVVHVDRHERLNGIRASDAESLGRRMSEVEDRNTEMQQSLRQVNATLRSMAHVFEMVKCAMVPEASAKPSTDKRVWACHKLVDEENNGYGLGNATKDSRKCIALATYPSSPQGVNVLNRLHVQNHLNNRSPTAQYAKSGGAYDGKKGTSIDVTSPPKEVSACMRQPRRLSPPVRLLPDQFPYTCGSGESSPKCASETGSTGPRNLIMLRERRGRPSVVHNKSLAPVRKHAKKTCTRERKQIAGNYYGNLKNQKVRQRLFKSPVHCNGDISPVLIAALKRMQCDSLPVHLFGRIVNFLFDDQLPSNTTLVRLLGHTACRSNILRLRPGIWLDTEVIDCYSAFLTLRRRRLLPLSTAAAIWYLPAIVQQLVLQTNLSAHRLYSDYLTEASFGGDIQKCEQICVPMNYHGEHWYMFIIDFGCKKCFIYDSKPSEYAIASREAIANCVRRRIHSALLHGFGSAYNIDITSFAFQTPSWCPKQLDQFDCGMYVMKYMENSQEMQEGINFQFNSQIDRMRLAVELFVATENTVRNTTVMGVPGLENIQFT